MYKECVMVEDATFQMRRCLITHAASPGAIIDSFCCKQSCSSVVVEESDSEVDKLRAGQSEGELGTELLWGGEWKFKDGGGRN